MLLSAMKDHCGASVVRDPTHELDAVHVAFLVDTNQAGELKHVAGDLGDRWEGLVELRVLGPMAPYDFVVAAR
jgi:Gas vesicle synthesis protein GvpL/GvpF